MNKTIHELNSLSQAEATDELIIYDVSEGESKKIQVENLVGNQFVLSAFELIQQGGGTKTGTCEFDGYFYIRGQRSGGWGSCYSAKITDANNNDITLIGEADSGRNQSITVPVKKGDTYTIWVDSNSASCIKARWFKQRDYTGR